MSRWTVYLWGQSVGVVGLCSYCNKMHDSVTVCPEKDVAKVKEMFRDQQAERADEAERRNDRAFDVLTQLGHPEKVAEAYARLERALELARKLDRRR